MTDNTKTVRIVGNPPLRATEHSAACDLITTESGLLHAGERRLVKTGIRIALSPDTCAFVLPSSGLALKYGVTVANAPGLIDADYRGEIGVILINHGPNDVALIAGERIAQLMIAPYFVPKWEQVEQLDETVRGDGGFGSTGKA